MNRPWHIWVAFTLCLFAVLGAMGWVSVTVLRLENAEVNAQYHAEREENVRLALWRMDSALSPLIAAENARPYFVYRSFYPLERAFGNMLNTLNGSEILMPSPLLTQNSPYVQVHFQLHPDGTISSPQVPDKHRRLAANYAAQDKLDGAAAKLAELKSFLNRSELLSVLPVEELSHATPVAPNPDNNGQVSLAQTAQTIQNNIQAAPNNDEQRTVPPFTLNYVDPEQNEVKKQSDQPPVQPNPQQQRETFGNRAGKSQAMKNKAERDFRSNAYQQMAQQEKETQSLAWTSNPGQSAAVPQQQSAVRPEVCKTEPQSKDPGKPIGIVPMQPAQTLLTTQKIDPVTGPSEVAEGVSIPIWYGEYLLLARRCSVKNELYIQGCWLNWAAIRNSLLADIQDLLPDAELVADPSPPAGPRGDRGDSGERAAYMLAAIPVRLIPGTLQLEAGPFWTPIRLSLLVAWVCVVLAAAAVAVLLMGAVSLSERRGAFVSAVTHELRTPLTTFRMYTEMLSAGMVPDEQKRQGYLNTLRVEAERLSHLVENVLAYAKLERGPSQSRLQSISLKDLIEKTSSRLNERAAQVGMRLVVDSNYPGFEQRVKTDPSVVEQILFNLVDNACKYAVSAEKPEIRILVGSDGRFAQLKVCDNGSGFSDKDARNLFKPFCKSAKEAAHSAPGVGLGLALSRRLARDMGGDLRLDRDVKSGACFVISFPAA